MNNIDQLRAKDALESVTSWKGKDWGKKAAQRVKELPLMVRNLGVGQTLAILIKESQKRMESKALLEVLNTWILQKSPIKGCFPGNDGGHDADNKFERLPAICPERLLEICFEGSRDQYQLIQQEAIVYLGWLKTMADALIEEEEKSANG